MLYTLTAARAHSCHALNQIPAFPFSLCICQVDLFNSYLHFHHCVSPSTFSEHDSDSDSELSLDEHSSSYASSHSSDSEEDGLETEKKWNTSTSKNNEHGPLHSTPKGTPSARGGQWCSETALDSVG